MKKKNNKGFMLTEALVVSVLITTVLIFLYVHFKKVSDKVNASFKYDTIQAMYSLDSIRGYIEQENYVAMVSNLDIKDYVDISDCSLYYFTNTDFCKGVFSNAGIEKIFITKENMYGLLNNKSFESEYSSTPLFSYIKSIKYNKTDGYRLIAYFKDGSFANTKIFDGDNFLLNIANSCTASTNKNYTIRFVNASFNNNIIEDYIGQAGCGTIINASDYIDNVTDKCYAVANLTNTSIVVGTDEKLNVLTIPYNKLKSNVTINYLDLGYNTIMPTTTKSVECGLQFNPSESVVQKSGYIFDHASVDIITIDNSDIEINLFYKEEGA